jgi:hypothetical protein
LALKENLTKRRSTSFKMEMKFWNTVTMKTTKERNASAE